MPANKFILLAIAFAVTALPSCSGCRREAESIQVAGQSLELPAPRPDPQTPQGPTEPVGPRVIDIRARPYDGPPPTSGTSSPAADAAVAITSSQPARPQQTPPGAVVEEGLSKRLTDKLKEAKIPFNDKNPPKIYTSSQSISEFSNYYESKGQKVSRMSIPAALLIRPLLQEHPELAAKVNMDELEKITINQVVVEGTGVSAADKYIDPDTLQVVDKLFVTDMPSDMGK